MEVGKCKKKSDAFRSAQSISLRKMKKKKEKMRKPVEERRGSNNGSGGPSTTEEAIDGLVEFFNCLNIELYGIQAQENGESNPSGSTYEDPSSHPTQPDIQELEHMGALARDLILRIQLLRELFSPDSLAARALPDIRVHDGAASAEAMAAIAALGGDETTDALSEIIGATEATTHELPADEAAQPGPGTD